MNRNVVLAVSTVIGCVSLAADPAAATTDAGTCTAPGFYPSPFGTGEILPDTHTFEICDYETSLSDSTLVRLEDDGRRTPVGTRTGPIDGPHGWCVVFEIAEDLPVGTRYVLTAGRCLLDSSFPIREVRYHVIAFPTPPTSFAIELSALHRWHWPDGTTTSTFQATYASVPDETWARWHHATLTFGQPDGTFAEPSYDANGEIGVECPGDTRPWPGLAPGDLTARVTSPDTTVVGEVTRTYACDEAIEVHVDAGPIALDSAVAVDAGAPGIDAGEADDSGEAGSAPRGCSVGASRSAPAAWMWLAALIWLARRARRGRALRP